MGHQNSFICFYYLLERESFDVKLHYESSLFPSPLNVEVAVIHRQRFYSIFNIERGVGVGALWIKLTPVNVQASQHF